MFVSSIVGTLNLDPGVRVKGGGRQGRGPHVAGLDDYETRMFDYGTEAVDHSLTALDKFLPPTRDR
ncbi:hypothetical protein ACGFNV_09335 [Streptomyces sp. NPDC048751]|uniref:hypothetical protein n=1 Tax=Streptomyces sp. NPDC048751 TaxID=3365591 RepID=UPI003716E613